MRKVKAGIIGCGNISGIYLKNCTSMFESLEIKGCADIIPGRSQAKAEEFNIKAYTYEELLVDPEIEIIINLTVPKVHFEVCIQALKARGSHYVPQSTCKRPDALPTGLLPGRLD